IRRVVERGERIRIDAHRPAHDRVEQGAELEVRRQDRGHGHVTSRAGCSVDRVFGTLPRALPAPATLRRERRPTDVTLPVRGALDDREAVCTRVRRPWIVRCVVEPRAATIDRHAEGLEIRPGASPDSPPGFEYADGEPGAAQLACRDEPSRAGADDAGVKN